MHGRRCGPNVSGIGCAKAVRGGFLRTLHRRVKPVGVFSNATLAPTYLENAPHPVFAQSGSVEAAMAFETEGMSRPPLVGTQPAARSFFAGT
jgi:hypothetical protein